MQGRITKTEIRNDSEFIIDTWGWDFFCDAMMSDAKTFLDFLVQQGKI